MTIVGSGPLNLATIAAEYGVSATNAYLGGFYRGNPTKWVRANSGDNEAVNGSAGVPATATNLYIGNFYGQAKGWTYTNSVVRVNNYYPHGHFGSDWLGANGTGWPCVFVNNNGIYSTSTSYYACIWYARQDNGLCTFINNSEIQGAGGAPNSGAGQHAIYIYNSENASYANRPIMYNYYAIRGGGGAGGIGGQGGTGGQGYYNYTAQEGPYYQTSVPQYDIAATPGGDHGIMSVWWNGSRIYYQYAPPYAPFTIGSYVYYSGTLMFNNGSSAYWQVFRQWTATAYTSGGGGGGGGNGGRGIGYNSPNQGGNGGAAGAGGGTNAGSGGYGGTGGTGGSWGANGNTGNTGATGNGGNYTGGYGGYGGGGGGAAGYSIYAATKWGYANYNTNNGPYGGGVANS